MRNQAHSATCGETGQDQTDPGGTELPRRYFLKKILICCLKTFYLGSPLSNPFFFLIYFFRENNVYLLIKLIDDALRPLEVKVLDLGRSVDIC